MQYKVLPYDPEWAEFVSKTFQFYTYTLEVVLHIWEVRVVPWQIGLANVFC